MCTTYVWVLVGTRRGKEVSDTQELELRMTVSHLMWVLDSWFYHTHHGKMCEVSSGSCSNANCVCFLSPVMTVWKHSVHTCYHVTRWQRIYLAHAALASVPSTTKTNRQNGPNIVLACLYYFSEIQGGRDPGGSPGGWETYRYAMWRKRGYRVYLVVTGKSIWIGDYGVEGREK